MKPRVALVAAALLTLTGCGVAASAAPSSAPTAPALSMHDAKRGFLWSATLEAPGLAQKARLLHAGQDVCNDLGGSTTAAASMAGLRTHYAMTTAQWVAVTHAAVGFLCPVYRPLVDPLATQ